MASNRLESVLCRGVIISMNRVEFVILDTDENVTIYTKLQRNANCMFSRIVRCDTHTLVGKCQVVRQSTDVELRNAIEAFMRDDEYGSTTYSGVVLGTRDNFVISRNRFGQLKMLIGSQHYHRVCRLDFFQESDGNYSLVYTFFQRCSARMLKNVGLSCPSALLLFYSRIRIDARSFVELLNRGLFEPCRANVDPKGSLIQTRSDYFTPRTKFKFGILRYLGLVDLPEDLREHSDAVRSLSLSRITFHFLRNHYNTTSDLVLTF